MKKKSITQNNTKKIKQSVSKTKQEFINDEPKNNRELRNTNNTYLEKGTNPQLQKITKMRINPYPTL